MWALLVWAALAQAWMLPLGAAHALHRLVPSAWADVCMAEPRAHETAPRVPVPSEPGMGSALGCMACGAVLADVALPRAAPVDPPASVSGRPLGAGARPWPSLRERGWRPPAHAPPAA